MVNAYNTGRTARQLQTGTSVLEKAADFELADAAVVLEQLYPSAVKTSAQIKRSTAVSTEYALPVTYLLARRAQAAKRAAAGSTVLPPPCAKPEPLPIEEAERIKHAKSRVRENQRQLEESRRIVSAPGRLGRRTSETVPQRTTSASITDAINERGHRPALETASY